MAEEACQCTSGMPKWTPEGQPSGSLDPMEARREASSRQPQLNLGLSFTNLCGQIFMRGGDWTGPLVGTNFDSEVFGPDTSQQLQRKTRDFWIADGQARSLVVHTNGICFWKPLSLMPGPALSSGSDKELLLR